VNGSADSALALAKAFREGRLSPVAVTEAALARVQSLNPTLNAFVALRVAAALDEARNSAERYAAGRPLSALDGVPLAVKDNLLTFDMPTTWGSMALQGHQPPHDELAVARARAAGLVIIGKTNVPEFTLEGFTANSLFGITPNPWDLQLTPGGSSGGSVSAVASGMVPLALGTDGGGSIRRPAGYTGLVGLKPSIGAIPREHALPPLLLDFEVVGVLARGVEDALALFDVIAGPHPQDRASLAMVSPQRSWPDRPRILYVPTLGGAPVDPIIDEACRDGVLRLAGDDHELKEGPLQLDLTTLNEQWSGFGEVGLATLFDTHPAWREGAGSSYRAMADRGAARPASWLWAMLEQVTALRREADRLFESIDLIITPSSAAMPWPTGQPFPGQIAGRRVGPRGHAIFTGWVNATGLPAVALPVSPSGDGMPIGIQCIGPMGSDRSLWRWAASAARRCCPEWRDPPALTT
jgi:aspartyl-tRNA(Asn)/glutamyl-tRNA(Gln) amidotransferase subunit A